MSEKTFQPFVSPETEMKEFTFKALLMGSIFGILFGASTVYLALKAGLTVSASIPIAVLAITLGRQLFQLCRHLHPLHLRRHHGYLIDDPPASQPHCKRTRDPAIP